MGITIDSYSDALKTRMLSQMKILGCKLGAFPPKTLYETWILDESYNKMIAAVDMFFHRFPSNQDSSMRICTLRSRYKDCSGLLSIGYICNLLNLSQESKILDWIFTEKLSDEMEQMLKIEEEITGENSYFPYQSDLKLVQKTYYFATKNPHTYFVIHAVGTLLNSTRSKHAKFLSDHNVINNVFNAKINCICIFK